MKSFLKKITVFFKLASAVLLYFLLLNLSACTPAPDNKKETPNTKDTANIPKPIDSDKPKIKPVSKETKDLYQHYCAQCHGVKGKGDGINAPHLTVPPRDHTKASYLETRSDEQLFMAIQEGGRSVGRAPCMPRWGDTLDEKSIHSLVLYIRELCQCEAL